MFYRRHFFYICFTEIRMTVETDFFFLNQICFVLLSEYRGEIYTYEAEK